MRRISNKKFTKTRWTQENSPIFKLEVLALALLLSFPNIPQVYAAAGAISPVNSADAPQQPGKKPEIQIQDTNANVAPKIPSGSLSTNTGGISSRPVSNISTGPQTKAPVGHPWYNLNATYAFLNQKAKNRIPTLQGKVVVNSADGGHGAFHWGTEEAKSNFGQAQYGTGMLFNNPWPGRVTINTAALAYSSKNKVRALSGVENLSPVQQAQLQKAFKDPNHPMMNIVPGVLVLSQKDKDLIDAGKKSAPAYSPYIITTNGASDSVAPMARLATLALMSFQNKMFNRLKANGTLLQTVKEAIAKACTDNGHPLKYGLFPNLSHHSMNKDPVSLAEFDKIALSLVKNINAISPNVTIASHQPAAL